MIDFLPSRTVLFSHHCWLNAQLDSNSSSEERKCSGSALEVFLAAFTCSPRPSGFSGLMRQRLGEDTRVEDERGGPKEVKRSG